jgi:FKBP-type peptidyl-prolyl cis-trans isomerase 2
MVTIQKDDSVTLIYTGKLDNGEVFSSITEDQPLVAQIGNLELPPSLEEAILGMKIGDSTTVRVPPEEGFGIRQKKLLQTITSEEMIMKIKPTPGMILSLKVDKEGVEHHVPATVISVTGNEMLVDYNHPLAGHHLSYTVTIIDISRDASGRSDSTM